MRHFQYQKRKINLLYLFIFSLILQSQIFCSEKITKKVCIWEVQSKTTICYLLGSIHLLQEKNYPLDPIFETVLGKAEHVIFEINMDQAQRPEIQIMISEKAKLAIHEPLEKRLSKKTYSLVKSEGETLGLNMNILSFYKPWYIAIMIGQMKLAQMGFNPLLGIDMVLYQKAKMANKKIHGFETISFQIELFDKLDANIQELFLLQTLEDLKIIKNELNQIVSAWETGNIQDLEKPLLESFQDYPKIYNKIIVERNQNWLKEIISCLNKKEIYLIIVGVGHFLGNDGLINLLKHEGYSVNQLQE